ncbi:DUF2790 domain-containing protein [Azomonas macrocytogenes]|uniref:DUF2790 domain-containing protein n=1 Tax=Azomonas macrocytogenes TaxID=69962 RepID=A0A839T3J8_AZOMA|nr:DUF2790 domain-containing protein [Azomonas macrocytogenes]MBB3104107.1 hypothetical protein [Azomonas macrocytogenes]
MRKAIFIAIFTCLPAFVFASTPIAEDEFEEHVNLKRYKYGMKLDIKRVISVSETPSACHPGPKWMVYEDSTGERHTLEYMVMGDGCNG